MPKKTILLAEDDPLIAMAYKDGLSSGGFKVIHCQSGEETLLSLKKKEIDLLLLDLRMPEKDGFQVLEEMNQNKLIHNIPVLVTSNLDQKTDMDRCKKLGAKDYFVKSNLSLASLLKEIEKYLSSPLKE